MLKTLLEVRCIADELFDCASIGPDFFIGASLCDVIPENWIGFFSQREDFKGA